MRRTWLDCSLQWDLNDLSEDGLEAGDLLGLWRMLEVFVLDNGDEGFDCLGLYVEFLDTISWAHIFSMIYFQRRILENVL